MMDVSVKHKLIFFLLRMPPEHPTQESICELNGEVLCCQVLDEKMINIIQILSDFHVIRASVGLKGEADICGMAAVNVNASSRLMFLERHLVLCRDSGHFQCLAF